MILTTEIIIQIKKFILINFKYKRLDTLFSLNKPNVYKEYDVH